MRLARVLVFMVIGCCAWAGVATAVSDPDPEMTTEPATSVQDTSALLAGTIDAHGVSTTWRFEYGRTSAYGQQTSDGTAAGDRARPAWKAAQGLQPSTEYHFRLVALRGTTRFEGADRMFVTAPVSQPPQQPPHVQTGPPGFVTANSAFLNGGVDTDGTYQFEWGTTTAYGNSAPAVPQAASGPMVSQQIAALTPSTTYHYRVVLFRGPERYEGADWQFTTPAGPAATPTPTPTTTSTPTPTVAPSATAGVVPSPTPTIAPASLAGASKKVSLKCAPTCVVTVKGAAGKKLVVRLRQGGRLLAGARTKHAVSGAVTVTGRPAAGTITVDATVGSGHKARSVSATFVVR